ncbi:ABC transporter permease [Robbsia sp. Bb-Pol-6]|uniref:ABC transporter permease n=1 Tax=Robbsia betulipollinis TaxID=2981849 RepID=A0ABT3ZMU0_9BURK|nr:FtsX-like permease family protein [Robbsia betulipollinis]MCY0387727.1 ABC transporter permease [Robbsia betulipollinis]
MTRRDWRAGELTTLLLALVLAVAALTSVGFVADRMRQGLERDARQMFGADLRIRSDRPMNPVFEQEARRRGLRSATTAEFPSMAAAVGAAGPTPAASNPASAAPVAQATRLAAVKAVSAGYPLRGAVTIVTQRGPHAPERDARAIPTPGTVWVDPALLDALQLRLGDTLQLGNRDFTIAGVIVRELDRGFSFLDFSPRVMLRADELAATGLTGRGSRVTYRLLVAGDDARALASYERWAAARIAHGPDGGDLRGVRLESLAQGQPQVRETFERADRFLRLVALLTSLLAAVAIAMAAQRYARRHIDGCAVMRCLGASERTLRGLFVIEFLFLGVLGGVLGSVLGFVGHWVLLRWLAGLIGVALPWPTLWPVAQGMGAGLILLLGFALPPLFPLTRVPPGRVLRRDWGTVDAGRWRYAIGIVLFAGLLITAAGEWRLGLIVAGGFAVGVLVFAAVGWLAIKALGRIARHRGTRRPGMGKARATARGFGWRYALASLERRGGASAVQITALGIALMCLLLLGMTRNDLIAGWRKSTPPDAPNRFIIDIQPDQMPSVTRYLMANGLSRAAPAPMIRGRLTARNGQAVAPAQFKEDRVQRLVEREFNLSYRTTLPADNRLTAGHWYGADPAPQISIEAGLARDLGIKVGDRLRFEVAGQAVEAPVTSVRKLDWGSFRVNFFVLMPPAALAGFPSTYITSFHADVRQQPAIDTLVRQYPNLTVIDTGAILAQLQRVLDQVIDAVQFLFLFTLAAGLVVLYAALAGSRDERSRESALLRALGASHGQVRAAQLAEFTIVGALSGAMAALGAQSIAWLLAQRVFDFPLTPNPWMGLVGVAAGLVCSIVGGWWSLRNVLRRPALQSLRET